MMIVNFCVISVHFNYKANSLGSSCRNCFSMTIKFPYEGSPNFQGLSMNTIDNSTEEITVATFRG